MIFGGFNKNINYVKKVDKIGRNEKCICGSGKKFKKCHGLAGALHGGFGIQRGCGFGDGSRHGAGAHGRIFRCPGESSRPISEFGIDTVLRLDRNSGTRRSLIMITKFLTTSRLRCEIKKILTRRGTCLERAASRNPSIREPRVSFL